MRLHRISFFFFALIFISKPLFAGKPLVLKQEVDFYNMNSHFSYFVDEARELTLKQVLSGAIQKQFSGNEQVNPSFGMTEAAIWGRFTWEKGDSDDKNWFLFFEFPLLEEVTLYIPEGKGYKVIESGRGDMRFNSRPVIHRKIVFPLKLPAKRQTVYFQAKSRDDALDMSAKLTTKAGLARTTSNEMFVHGFYFGLACVMLLFNFALYLTNKDRDYLYYFFYIFFFAVALAELQGFVFMYIFPESADFSIWTRNIGGAGTAIFAGIFTGRYLNLKENFPSLSIAIKMVALLIFANLFLRDVHYVLHTVIYAWLIIAGCLLIILAAVLSYKKSIFARYYLFSWTMFLVFVIIYCLRVLGWTVPYVATYCLEFSNIFVLIAMSFVLTRRIKALQKEKDDMHVEAINNMLGSLKHEYRLKTLKVRNEVVENDLELAKKLQLSLIPAGIPEKGINTIYFPMDKVGGDFFDFIEISKEELGIFISDVSGHGVSAAFITGMLKSILSEVMRTFGGDDIRKTWLTEPRKLMLYLNESLYGQMEGKFISCMYTVYNESTGFITYVSAAHPPPLVLRRAPHSPLGVTVTFLEVTPQAPLVGIFDSETFAGYDFEVYSVRLPDDSITLFYSDGFMENINYDYQRMHDGLTSFRPTVLYDVFRKAFEMSPGDFNEKIKKLLMDNKEQTRLDDDICMISIHR